MEKILECDQRSTRLSGGNLTDSEPVRRDGLPLRECTEAALKQYFADLNGCKTGCLYDMVMREVEQPLLKTVLEYTRGNQTQAAKILGLNRSTLRKKLRNHGLSDPSS
jgi:Fis family transcriptional regulator